MNTLQEINIECVISRSFKQKQSIIFFFLNSEVAREMRFRAEMTTFFKRFSFDLFLDKSKTHHEI